MSVNIVKSVPLTPGPLSARGKYQRYRRSLSSVRIPASHPTHKTFFPGTFCCSERQSSTRAVLLGTLRTRFEKSGIRNVYKVWSRHLKSFELFQPVRTPPASLPNRVCSMSKMIFFSLQKPRVHCSAVQIFWIRFWIWIQFFNIFFFL